MCGRYRRTTFEEELPRIYHIPIPKETDLPISYNIAPSQKVDSTNGVKQLNRSCRSLFAMKDGCPSPFAGLWENWRDPESGEWLRTCTIIIG
jgi:putative SOS response-associated peptidase YedK